MRTLTTLLLLASLIVGCAMSSETAAETAKRIGGSLEDTIRAVEDADEEGKLIGNPWLTSAKAFAVALQAPGTSAADLGTLFDSMRDLGKDLPAQLRAAGITEQWQLTAILVGYYNLLRELEWQLERIQRERENQQAEVVLPEPIDPAEAPS